MRFFSFLATICVLIPATSHAENLVRNYSTFDETVAKLDEVCLSEVDARIFTVFDKLEQIILSNVTSTAGNALLTYTEIELSSGYGETTTGVFTCLFRSGSADLQSVALNFDGLGLVGFNKHPTNDPADQRVRSYSWDIQ